MVADVAESMPRRLQPYTVDDLFTLDDDWHRFEVWEGSLIVSPPPGAPHQRFADRLQTVLESAAPAGVEALTAVGARLGEDETTFVPDVLVGKGTSDPRGLVYEAGDLLAVVEVVSPGSRQMDRIAKPAVYAAAGIPCYWRVELDEFPGQGDGELPVVLVHVLDGDAYRLSERLPGGAPGRLSAPFPVEFDPATLLRRA